MIIKKVTAVFFSPTGSTRKVVEEIASGLAGDFWIPWDSDDFTLPYNRSQARQYSEDDLVIFGLPVYAGRIPNKILPDVQGLFKGNGALAVPVVTFGNRSYDNALIELRNELENNGFHTIAGGAFAAEHAFSGKLATGRPDAEDMEFVRHFSKAIYKKIDKMEEIPDPVRVKGTEPIPPYYRPLREDGKPAVFLKAKPKITEACVGCGACTQVCPMGSITNDQGWKVQGICIKCQACVKECPVQAIYFDDPDFLSHAAMLEQHYTRPAENEIFV